MSASDQGKCPSVRLGVSSCLLGESVRYDGAHKLDRFLTDTLGQYVEYVPICPEVECGFGVPREPMRLVGNPHTPRLVTVHSGKDHTEAMLGWARRRVLELEAENLCGFIFKSGSPSSGMECVKVYNENGIPVKNGIGLFAGVFMAHFPLLPVEDESRLHNPEIREGFIESIFVMKRWRKIVERERSIGNLLQFHTKHKLMLLAHSPEHYRIMGKLLAEESSSIPLEKLVSNYRMLLMETLRRKTTVKKNTNVLHHLLGYFKKQLSADEKKELLEIIELYRGEHVPLIVPVTLVNHFVRKYDQPYLKEQYYLRPHPLELQLRNHV